MATNLATAQEIYSKKFFKALQAEIPRLRAFSTSFTDELIEPGETIKVPLVSPDAVGAWDADSNNFKRPEAALVEVSLPARAPLIAGFSISPSQMRTFRPNWWEGKAETNVEEISDTVLTDIAGLITKDNYGDDDGDKLNVKLPKFGPDDVATIRGAAVKRKLRVSRSVLGLNPDFYSKLLGALPANLYGGREAYHAGIIPGLLGFRAVVEIPQLDAPGFVCHPDAIAVGTRRFGLPSDKPYLLVRDITEPSSGLTLTIVIYPDGPSGSLSYSVTCVPAIGVGNDKALMRLV